MTAPDGIGEGYDGLDGVVADDVEREGAHEGCSGRCQRVARSGTDDQQFEDTGGVSQQSACPRNTIVHGLQPRSEIAVGFARHLGVGHLPAVDQLVGGCDAMV